MLRGAHGPVRALDLAGFEVDEGRALLRDKQLQGETDAWEALVQGHDGNGLALKVVGETIRDTFGGSIAAYLEFANVPSVMVGALQDLLATQISRISDDEHDLLLRMAVAREPVSVPELAAGLAPRVDRAAALVAIEGLRRRSLLEHTDGSSRWGLHPVVQEYTTQELINEVRRELDTGELRSLQRQPLLEATTKDYLRRAQERLIVGPIVGGLRALDGNGQIAERRLVLLLGEQRGRSIEQQGYAPGNLINLLVALRGDLKGVDLSGLAIRQAYLHDIEAQEASFAGAHVLETVLGEAFTYATCLALSADGAHLIAGTAGGEVCRWRVADRTLVATVTGHDGRVYSVALSEDGRLIASAGYDGTVRLWETEGARALMVLNGHSGGVRAVALSADGCLLASGGMDGTLRIWDTATGEQRKTIDAHGDGVRTVAMCARGKLIASGGVDGVVRVWNADDGEPVATLAGHTGSINSVALSADGGVVASGSLDATIRIWHTEGAEPGATLEGHAGSVDSIALGVDGQRIVSGSLDGSVRVWEAASGRALATLHGHTGGVRSIAVSGNGQLIASSSIDGTVRLWETDGGRPLAILRDTAAPS
jgi:WD domain, G-beta repeat